MWLTALDYKTAWNTNRQAYTLLPMHIIGSAEKGDAWDYSTSWAYDMYSAVFVQTKLSA